MKIHILEKESLDDIKTLWEALNSQHAQLSPYFKQYYQNFSFENRKEKLLKKDHLKIFVATESDNNIGYCIASVDSDIGEIDSIFILSEFRNNKIGYKLMNEALIWLQKQNCVYIDVLIADGNEGVLPFYEKYGFKKRATIMRKA